MSEGLTIFGKTVFDTLFVDYRIMVPTAIVSVIIFLIGVYFHLSKWGQAIPEGSEKPLGAWGAFKLIISRIFENGVGAAIGFFVLDVLLQRRIWRRRKTEWVMHILIFWGWIGLLILTIASATAEFYGPFVKNTDYTFFASFWKSIEPLNDFFAYMLVIGIVIAIVRRLAFADVPPARFTSFDWIALIGLAIVVITGFWAQSIRIGSGVEERMLISAYKSIAPNFFDNAVVVFHEVFTLLFCIAYLPFSKFFHILVTPLTILVNKGGYVEVNP